MRSLCLFSAAVLFLIACSSDQQTSTKEQTVTHLLPKERELLPLMWPASTFNDSYYMRVLNDAQDFMRTGQRSGDWRLEGPKNIGGRINAVEIDPSNPDVIYVGAAAGGVWKSTDGGFNWEPIFDNQLHLSISCIAIHPQNSSIIYVGTGDKNIGGSVFLGNGIYKSVDGGSTWEYSGLAETKIISRILIDPNDPSVLYAGTMGSPFVPNEDRGLYKSTDGGLTWSRKLFLQPQAGIIDVVMDPSNSAVLYAVGFNRVRTYQVSIASGNDARIWKSIDAGETWQMLTNGLPTTPQSRIALAISPSNPNKLVAAYCGVNFELGGIFYTTDAGASWQETGIGGAEDAYFGFGWYFGKIYINPEDDNEWYLNGVDQYKTTDNGASWFMMTPVWWTYEVHADGHDMAFFDADRFLLATDGGLYSTADRGSTWSVRGMIPITQFYRVTTNPWDETLFYGGAQDNGTSVGNYEDMESWPRVFGGDGFKTLVDPVFEEILYCSYQFGGFMYTDDAGLSFYPLSIPSVNEGERYAWDAPWTLDPQDPTTLYAASNRVFRVEDAPYGIGDPISDDLSDGLSGEEGEVASVHAITCLEIHPDNSDFILAGTGDGNVWKTTDGRENWEMINTGLPNRWVTDIEAIGDRLFVSFQGYNENDNSPHIYTSTNEGASWTNYSGNLPDIGINDMLVASAANGIFVFIATDAGVMYTLDGANDQVWLPLGTNLPVVRVRELALTSTQRIAAATFARGIYSYDASDILTVGVAEAHVVKASAWPNPVVNQLQLSHIITGHVYSADGKQVLSLDNPTSRIDFSSLKSGHYFVKGWTPDRKRFLIQVIK
jgi:photosystem II stability/assembly factor-like uncharacterized protein